MALPKKNLTPDEAKLKMADLCARSEQCEYDINQKLFRLGIYSDHRSDIITYLREHGFIDDNRFAESYARDKCRFSGWGPYKIRQGLKAKRIPTDIISEAIDEVEEKDWEEALQKASASKAKSLDLTGEEKHNNRLKLARFLLYRGFGYEDVKEAVRQEVRNQLNKD